MTAGSLERETRPTCRTARALAPVCPSPFAVGVPLTLEGAKWMETTTKLLREPTGRSRAQAGITRPER